jgi:FKBP-type peptidyl-prolyl cis-trans isomerase
MVTLAVFFCGAQENSAGMTDSDISYALGLVLGSDLKQFGLQFDYNALAQGIQATVEGKETRMSLEEAVGLVQTAYIAAMNRQAEETRAKSELFLAENGKKAGIVTTASGLQYEVVVQGQGNKPAATDEVTVNYEGKFIDGTVFDSSYTRGEPAEFPLDQVIPGWSEGIQLMNVGSTYRLYIPSALAYGERGAGNMIPPHSVLIFQVELLAIK